MWHVADEEFLDCPTYWPTNQPTYQPNYYNYADSNSWFNDYALPIVLFISFVVVICGLSCCCYCIIRFCMEKMKLKKSKAESNNKENQMNYCNL